MNRGRNNRKTKRSMPIIILLLVVIGVGLFGVRRCRRKRRNSI